MGSDVAGDWLVGRDEELAVLRGLVAEVKAGVGGAVLVEGEQGIGKTALLRAGLAGAGARCRVVWGAADELGRQFPLALMLEVLGPEGRLAAVGEEAGWRGGGRVQAGPGAARSPVLFIPSGDPVLAGVERLLVLVDRWCAAEPVVLVAEDLQWADEASVLVWHQLCRAVRQLPLLLAGSMRSVAEREDLGALRQGVLAGGGGVISLGSLSSREVASLVGRVVGGRPGRQLVAAASRAGGNPLYARELAEALVRQGQVYLVGRVARLAAGEGDAGVPESLAGVIGRRLAVLGEDVLAVLRWAAVLGQEFSATDLQAVTGRDADELVRVVGQAVAAGVVVEAGSRLGFRHGLIRQVLYEGMPVSLRAALHRRAARALDGAGVAAERVAAQLVAAVPEISGKWVRDWLAGAASELAYRAPQAAARLLRAALAEFPLHDVQRDPLEAALVQAAFLLGDDAEVERAGTRLLARSLSPDHAAQVAWLFSYSLMRTGRPAEAAQVVAEALSRPGTGDAEALRLRALQAMIPVALGRLDEAARIAQDVLAGAERLSEVFAAGYALFALIRVSLFRRDWPTMERYVEQALRVIGDDPETTDLRLLLLTNQFAVLQEMDRHQEAITTAQEALAIAERSGTSRVEVIRSFLGTVYFAIGRWDDALAELETAAGSPDRGAGPPQLVHGLSALIAGHRDDTDAAAQHLEAVADIPVRQAAFMNSVGDLLLARALAAERAGLPREAEETLAQCLDPSLADVMGGDKHELLPTLTRIALANGDATIAAAAAAAARDAYDEPLPLPCRTAPADHCRGLVEADPAVLLAAADVFESAGRPLQRGLALEDAAVLMAGHGDSQGARTAFAKAAGLYEALGARWDIRRAEARLRPHSIHRSRSRRSHPPAGGWDALTPTETKIAHMIASGQSNPDIAARLFLSRNTVQTHVSHILTKLGAGSRVEVARQILLSSPDHEDTAVH